MFPEPPQYVYQAKKVDSIQLKTLQHQPLGSEIRPREWFLVPLFVINEAIEKIRDGGNVYDPKAAALVRVVRT